MMRIYDVSEEVCWQLTVFTDDMVEWMDMEVCKQEAKHANCLWICDGDIRALGYLSTVSARVHSLYIID